MNIEYVISKNVDSAEKAISIVDELVGIGILDSHSLEEVGGTCSGEIVYRGDNLPAQYDTLPWVPSSVDAGRHLYISWVLGDDLGLDSIKLKLLGDLKDEIHEKTELQFNEQVDPQTEAH